MSNLLQEQFAALTRERECVEVFRSGRQDVVGRLIAASQYVFVLEKVLDLDVDGVVAARIQDVTRVRARSPDLELMSRLFVGRTTPEIERVALLEMSSAITILNQMFGAVAIYAEDSEPGVCIVGQEVALDDDWVQIREFGPRAKRGRSDTVMSLSTITRVEAGGKYVRALREIYYPNESVVS